jgi:hypothetical protein
VTINKMTNNEINTAEKVREACAKEFIRAYEEAGIKGLCEEGRIEYALDAVRSLNLEKILIVTKHKN